MRQTDRQTHTHTHTHTPGPIKAKKNPGEGRLVSGPAPVKWVNRSATISHVSYKITAASLLPSNSPKNLPESPNRLKNRRKGKSDTCSSVYWILHIAKPMTWYWEIIWLRKLAHLFKASITYKTKRDSVVCRILRSENGGPRKPKSHFHVQ